MRHLGNYSYVWDYGSGLLIGDFKRNLKFTAGAQYALTNSPQFIPTAKFEVKDRFGISADMPVFTLPNAANGTVADQVTVDVRYRFDFGSRLRFLLGVYNRVLLGTPDDLRRLRPPRCMVTPDPQFKQDAVFAVIDDRTIDLDQSFQSLFEFQTYKYDIPIHILKDFATEKDLCFVLFVFGDKDGEYSVKLRTRYIT